MTKLPIALLNALRNSGFGFLSSFVIRHSSFSTFGIPKPARAPRAVLLVAALVCLSLSLTAAEKTYTVKRNDTLSDLAHRNGLTIGELAGRNELAKTDKLRLGQKLVVPDSGAVKEDSASSSLLPKGLDKTRVEPGKWKYIVIHHSASPNASVKGMDYYHRVERHMENG